MADSEKDGEKLHRHHRHRHYQEAAIHCSITTASSLS